MLAALAVFLSGIVVNAFRWQQFLRPLGLALPPRTLVRLYFVGTFFNAFLPTGFGGDAYRSLMMRQASGTMAPPLATAFLERLAGLAGLAILAVVGALLRLAAGDRGSVTWTGLSLSLAVLAVSAIALTLAGSARRAGDGAPPSGLRAKLRLFADAFATAGRERPAVVRGVAIGVVSAALLVAVHAFLVRSVSADIPIAALPVIVVIASLTTVLPVTINGLGLREAAYVWCLGAYGVSHDVALAFALLVLGVTLASSAVGGVVYALAGGELSPRP